MGLVVMSITEKSVGILEIKGKYITENLKILVKKR